MSSIESDVGRERKMDEGSDTKPRRFALDDVGHRPERQAIDDHAVPVGIAARTCAA